MRSHLIDEMYRLEEIYWWHIAKRRMVFALLHPHIKEHKGKLRLVDAGCGTGMMLKELSSYGEVLGLDGSTNALSYCRKRGFSSILLTDLSDKLPLRSEVADVVTMLDVLEHLDRDEVVLKEIYRILKPGGIFVLTVPAYPIFWTYWDEILGHKRRYRRSALVTKLKKAGFQVIRHSYFYTYLLPVAIFFRLAKNVLSDAIRNRSDFVALPSFINRLLLGLSTIETAIVRRINIPTGLSIICVGKK